MDRAAMTLGSAHADRLYVGWYDMTLFHLALWARCSYIISDSVSAASRYRFGVLTEPADSMVLGSVVLRYQMDVLKWRQLSI